MTYTLQRWDPISRILLCILMGFAVVSVWVSITIPTVTLKSWTMDESGR